MKTKGFRAYYAKFKDEPQNGLAFFEDLPWTLDIRQGDTVYWERLTDEPKLSDYFQSCADNDELATGEGYCRALWFSDGVFRWHDDFATRDFAEFVKHANEVASNEIR